MTSEHTFNSYEEMADEADKYEVRKRDCICSVEQCENIVRTKGLCSLHYQRVRKHGNPFFGEYPSVCAVDGCGRKYYAKNLCNRHYSLMYRNGDLIGRQKTKGGEVKNYFESFVRPYEGNDCLIWPYASLRGGYAGMTVDGKTVSVSRFLCEDTHGAAPTPDHHAAHSCGKGKSGCVNKRHLRWATPSENQMDRVLHGTHNRGERGTSAKLSESQVREILANGRSEKLASLARRYEVSRSTVRDIVSRRNWAWLD